jgi:hypothetical protein
MSGVSPTAPFHVNKGLVAGGFVNVHGDAPLVAPSVVAGSPRIRGVEQLLLSVQPGYGTLKPLGNCVPGRPAAISASPESGPKENMNVCVPSPIVA